METGRHLFSRMNVTLTGGIRKYTLLRHCDPFGLKHNFFELLSKLSKLSLKLRYDIFEISNKKFY